MVTSYVSFARERGANPRNERGGAEGEIKMTTDGGSKRKLVKGEASIYFLFNSRNSPKVAALFELKVTGYGGDDISPKDEALQLISTFYDQSRPKKPMQYVVCAPLDSGKYFLMPNEFAEENNFILNKNIDFESRDYSCIFDSVTKEATSLVKNGPEGRKVYPFAVTVGNKVYVLARRNSIQVVLPEPSFEAYDPEKNSWEPLPTPCFNENIPNFKSPLCTWGWRATGYAVLGNIIIVCLVHRSFHLPKHAIHSYNTISGNWKPVQYDSPTVYDDDNEGVLEYNEGDDNDGEYRIWDGEAVVINGFLFAYLSDFRSLASYSCTEASGGDSDISLGKEICGEKYERRDWKHMQIHWYGESGAVGKIGEDLICMVRTICTGCAEVTERQPVLASIFRIHKGGRCTKLKSFDLHMAGSKEFDYGLISSCFLLQPEVDSSMEDVKPKPNPKKPALSYKGAGANLVSEADMETSMA